MRKIISLFVIVVFMFASLPLAAEAKSYKTSRTHSYRKKSGSYIHSYTRKVPSKNSYKKSSKKR